MLEVEGAEGRPRKGTGGGGGGGAWPAFYLGLVDSAEARAHLTPGMTWAAVTRGGRVGKPRQFTAEKSWGIVAFL